MEQVNPINANNATPRLGWKGDTVEDMFFDDYLNPENVGNKATLGKKKEDGIIGKIKEKIQGENTQPVPNNGEGKPEMRYWKSPEEAFFTDYTVDGKMSDWEAEVRYMKPKGENTQPQKAVTKPVSQNIGMSPQELSARASINMPPLKTPPQQYKRY